MEWGHGGDVKGYALQYGRKPLDFSANVSPFGMPEGVKRAVTESLAWGAEYPDPLCRELRQALGDHLGLPADWILCGSGASDLLYRLTMAVQPKRALLTAPAFSEYEGALKLHGCQITRFPLTVENGFCLTEVFLNWITPETDLVFLCQPNNPTGRTTDRELLLRILQRCRETGTILALDECFLDFVDMPETLTMQGELEEAPLVIFRAFTKFYGMAGLRLGYCLCGDWLLLEKMSQAGPPWAVSSAAQAAGVAALKETAYGERLRRLILEQRPVLIWGLEECGCRVIPGEANYLLFYYPDEKLGEKMKEKGVMLRDCRNYHGLEPGWYRVAVRTEAENQRLLAVLKEVTGK